MPFLRFLMLLSLVAWLGGLIFFAFVLAPTVFSPGLLPSRQMAGAIVGRSLDLLHFIAIVSGIVFLISSMLYRWMAKGSARPLTASHLLIVAMLMLTIVSQFAISPRMHAIRAEAGVGAQDSVGVGHSVSSDDPQNNQRRQEFDRLHAWSERFEGVVLLLGLVVVYTTAQALK